MKVKRQAHKYFNKSWVCQRGREAQYSFIKSHRMDQKLGRTGENTFSAPNIPYERFVMNLLFKQGYGSY